MTEGSPVAVIVQERAWQPTSVFLPTESHGQRSLAGYSPRGHKELDTTDSGGLKSSRTISDNALLLKGCFGV